MNADTARPREAEREREQVPYIRARPWPERPVSEANKSGKHHAAPLDIFSYPRTTQGGR